MQGLTRRSLVLGAIAAPVSAYAQAWPTIRLVVPYPPAGSTDVIARLVQPELQRRFGGPGRIKKPPGAGGGIGTGRVPQPAPHGGPWMFLFDNYVAQAVRLGDLPFGT